MKAALVVILYAACACAPVAAEDQLAGTACGPTDVNFETQTSTTPTPAAPEAGKSQVYVIEVFDKVVGQLARPTLRVGLDGAWVGADKGNSYLTFSVDPGEHHLCANWQSRFKRYSREAAFAGFTADSGQTYYFRARITEHGGSGGASTFSLDLDPVNNDEGKYLVSTYPFSNSHPK